MIRPLRPRPTPHRRFGAPAWIAWARSMARRHPGVARLLNLLLAVCWLAGQGAPLMHAAEVQHVRCVEHGDVLELRSERSSAAASKDDGAQRFKAAPAGKAVHDDGCAMPHGLPQGWLAPPLAWAAPDFAAPLQSLRWAAAGARAPPLTYAPKTSPPVAC